jgi:CDP-glucose 4,6-dehydratase
MADPQFWRGKRVFITGHTGFKGAWLSLWLRSWGSEVGFYALPPVTEPSLSQSLGIDGDVADDVRDGTRLRQMLVRFAPDIVIHLAAQSLVPYGMTHPLETFEVNVLGTANLLEAAEASLSAKVALIVTSDKVYRNKAGSAPFQEDDALGGSDPYSASKAAAEQVVLGYRHAGRRPDLSLLVARAGNVLGGGDWASDRLAPDIIRAWQDRRPVVLRQPESTRPWQHVIDVLDGYLRLIERGWTKTFDRPAFNFGPAVSSGITASSQITARTLVERLQAKLPGSLGCEQGGALPAPEAGHLAIDSSHAYRELGWRTRLDFDTALSWTADWYKGFYNGAAVRELCLDQIRNHQALAQ